MIISHKHKFIFIKTQKTAGSTIELALSKICGPQDVLTPLDGEEEQLRRSMYGAGARNYLIPFRCYKTLDWLKFAYFRKRLSYFHHMSAQQIQWYLEPAYWQSYFKFSFERNPWDKVISYYYWEEADKEDLSVKDFLLSGRGGDMRGFDLYTVGGVPVVDKVFLYEQLEQSLQEISDILKLDEPLQLPAYKAKSAVRKDKRHYSDVISAEEADIIAKIFAREISYFSYRF